MRTTRAGASTAERLDDLADALCDMAEELFKAAADSPQPLNSITMRQVTGLSSLLLYAAARGSFPNGTAHAEARKQALCRKLHTPFRALFNAIGGPGTPFADVQISYTHSVGGNNGQIRDSITVIADGNEFSGTFDSVMMRVALLLDLHRTACAAKPDGASPCYQVCLGAMATDSKAYYLRASDPARAGLAALVYNKAVAQSPSTHVRQIKLMNPDPFRARAAAIRAMGTALDSNQAWGTFAPGCLDNAYPAVPAADTPVAVTPAAPKRRNVTKAAANAA